MRLWAWIKGWFTRGENSDLYSPRERAIYRFFDGQKVRCVDPLVLWQRLMDHHQDIMTDMLGAKNFTGDKGSALYQAMISDIRKVFEVEPFQDLGNGRYQGLTEAEVTQLYVHFYQYCDGWLGPDDIPEGGVKKNSPPPTTPATGTSAAMPPSSEENPPTRSSSASGSTAAEPSTEQPEPSSVV